MHKTIDATILYFGTPVALIFKVKGEKQVPRDGHHGEAVVACSG